MAYPNTRCRIAPSSFFPQPARQFSQTRSSNRKTSTAFCQHPLTPLASNHASTYHQPTSTRNSAYTGREFGHGFDLVPPQSENRRTASLQRAPQPRGYPARNQGAAVDRYSTRYDPPEVKHPSLRNPNRGAFGREADWPENLRRKTSGKASRLGSSSLRSRSHREIEELCPTPYELPEVKHPSLRCRNGGAFGREEDWPENMERSRSKWLGKQKAAKDIRSRRMDLEPEWFWI